MPLPPRSWGRQATLLAVLTGAPQAQASPVEFYGFGARAMGRAQGGVAYTDDAGAVFLNPAGLANLSQPTAVLGGGLIRLDFDELPPVYWDTNRDGVINEYDTPLDPGPAEEPGDGVWAALTHPYGGRVVLGMGLFLPKSRILRIDTFDPSIPTYFMYENRPQRYAFAMGGAVRLPYGLNIGGGVRIIPKAELTAVFTIDATVSGESADNSEASAEDFVGGTFDFHDLTVDITMDYAPVVGFQWFLGEVIDVPFIRDLSLGGGYRGEAGLPVVVNVEAQINGQVEDVGELDPQVVAAAVSMQFNVFDHYLPAQWSGGIAYSLEETLHLYFDVQYTRWSKMQLNVIHLVESDIDATLVDLSGLVIEDGNPMNVVLRDTVGIRLGSELTLPKWDVPGRIGWAQATVRGGFGYEPTPLVSQGSNTALLDADRLIFALGAGIDHGTLMGVLDGPLHWDVLFQYHQLAKGELQRPEIDEPQAGYAVGGAPIPIGGSIYAAGLQWSVDY
jgi:hypothetical protein